MNFKDFINNDYIGAGIVFVTKDKNILILKKESGKWTFPGGHREPGEEPLQTAKRECVEEIGIMPAGKISGKIKITKQEVNRPVYSFFMEVAEEFEPTLSWEHKDYKWIFVEDLDPKKLTKVFQPYWKTYKKLIKDL
jgi:8-oxo-dGTP pyrophosphatase MutT (NUDIX family)